MNKIVFFAGVALLAMLTQCGNNMDGDNNMDSDEWREYLAVNPARCLPDAKDRYVYPVLPGTDEWNASSSEEKVMLQQIPEDRLKSLSTYALIQGLLERPLLALDYLFSSNSSPIGTCYRIYSSHNSVAEMEERDDRFEALINYYKAVCFDCLTSLKENSITFQLTALEVLFTREKILQPLTTTQKQQIVSLLLEKYRLEQTNGLGITGSVTTMAWIMYDDHYAPVVQYYDGTPLSKEWFNVDTGQLGDIVLFAEKYISKSKES
jgi:hypothetical protein